MNVVELRFIGFIEKYLYMLDLYEKSNYLQKTFTILKGDRTKNLSKYLKYRGHNLAIAYIPKLYYLHPTAMDMNMFMNLQTLIPQSQIRNFKNDTLEVKIMKNLFEYYGSTYISSYKTILKNLIIVISSYLKFKLKMSNKDIFNSLELLFYDFIYEISNEYYDYFSTSIKNHLFSNIYIRGRINMVPIFGNSESVLKFQSGLSY